MNPYDRADAIMRERDIEDLKTRWEELKLIGLALNLQDAQLRKDKLELLGEASAYGVILD